jgi:hypothetical protein
VSERPHGRSKIGFRWTDELVSYGLERFHRRNLRTPTVREVKRGIDDLPSYATVRRRYGSVGAMLRRHGYLVRHVGAQPGRRCDLDRDATGRFTKINCDSLAIQGAPPAPTSAA